MLKKKTIFLVVLAFLVTSCADTFDSAKRGLTGKKLKSTDEFFIQKKDPLILPPDFENLPSPSEREEAHEEVLSFEKELKKATETEITSTSAGSSTEDSILKRIKKQ